jgi:hypothetical protein
MITKLNIGTLAKPRLNPLYQGVYKAEILLPGPCLHTFVTITSTIEVMELGARFKNIPIFNRAYINDVELFSGIRIATYELIQGSLYRFVVRTRLAGGQISLRRNGITYPTKICQRRFAGIISDGFLEINGQTYKKIKY